MGWKAVAVALAASIVSISTANAGLLDFLFARRQPAPIATPVVEHPRVTVSKPRAKRAARVVRAKPIRQPRMLFTDRKAVLAASIDPVANPDWYLFDPTLKRGDILVLNNGVLVFTGGQIGAARSYVALERSKLLNRAERLQVAEMTRRPTEPRMLADGIGPRQPRLLKSASLVRPPVLGAGL